MTADGYLIEEATSSGMVVFAHFGTDEPSAIAACRWYNHLLRGRRVFRVVLRVQDHTAVIHA